MRILATCLALSFFSGSALFAEDLLWIENGAALPGSSGVAVPVAARHDEPLHAFSLAVRFRAEVLEFEGVDLDSSGIVTGEVGYDYSHARVDNENGTAVVAVLLDLDPPYDFHAIPPSPDEDQVLAKLLFTVRTDAEPGSYPLQLRNGLGDPPIENVFSTAGKTTNPELESSVFTVTNPNHLYVKGAQALAGGTAVVQIEAEHLDPIGGYTIVLRYPSDVLSIDTAPFGDPGEEDLCKWPITFCGLNLEDELGTDGTGKYPIELFSAGAVADYPYSEYTPGEGSGRLYAAAVFDYRPPWRDQTLSAGTQRILKVLFEVSDTVSLGQEITVTPVNGTGEPATDNIYVVPLPDQPDISVRPDLHEGTITIVKGFRRGFINPTDARMDLADVIYLLGYMFGGGPAPACEKAADVTDDGKLDIGDAIRMLGYLFKGIKPPAAPFEECGGDPTPDDLTCDMPIGCDA